MKTCSNNFCYVREVFHLLMHFVWICVSTLPPSGESYKAAPCSQGHLFHLPSPSSHCCMFQSRTSPCLNTQPFTQWTQSLSIVHECLFTACLFFVDSLLFCAQLCLITLSSVLCQSIYTGLNQRQLSFQVKKKKLSGSRRLCRCGNSFSFHASGKWHAEEELLLWCSCVYHSEGEQVSSGPVDTGKRRGLSNRAWHYWSHRWSLKPLVPWNDGGAGSAYQQTRAFADCVQCVIVTTTEPEPIHTVWECALNKASGKNISVMTAV